MATEEPLVPANYRVTVAIKKVSWIVGMLAVGFAMAKGVGKYIPAVQVEEVQNVVIGAVAGVLELIHDWAHLKWGDKYAWL